MAVGSGAIFRVANARPGESSPIVHRELIRARFTDADAQGAVHHSTYVKWIEEARLGWLRRCGIPYRTVFAGRGLAIVVAELSLKFVSLTTFEEQILVSIRLRKGNRARLDLEYELHRAGGELVATALTRLAFVDSDGRPIRLPRNHPLLEIL
jgi:acyl-CoA thioester hydrolase